MTGIMIVPRGAPDGTATRFGTVMGMLFVGGSAFTSRLFIIGLWIFSDLLGDAYESAALPIIGFLLLPWTTCAYAAMWGISSDGVSGWEWIVVAVALITDLVTWAVTARLVRR
jgi:hypothetical protein